MTNKPLSESDARKILELAIDHCEGRITLPRAEIGAMGVLFVIKWHELLPVLVDMCGSEEAALEKAKLLNKLAQMGQPPTEVVQ